MEYPRYCDPQNQQDRAEAKIKTGLLEMGKCSPILTQRARAFMKAGVANIPRQASSSQEHIVVSRL